MEKEKIINAEVEEKIELTKHPYYIEVRFCENIKKNNVGEGTTKSYYWTAYDERRVSPSFPMYSGNPNKVASLKTLIGAKRNFLRTYPKQDAKVGE